MTCPVGTDVARAAEFIRTGELVAFATETVYGLGGNALDDRAVARIFEAKERPAFDPLIVHLASLAQLEDVAKTVPEVAYQLAETFWPGPMTLVLPKQDSISDLVTSGLSTVGVRIPAHPIARQLIEASGVPIAAPSANRFGQISPTTAAHVADQLGDRIAYILDGGPCSVGLESTIVNCTSDTPEVLRLGGLSVEQIEQAIGPVTVRIASSDPGNQASEEEKPIAPGMLKRHYAPRTPLVDVDSLDQIKLKPTDALLLPEPTSLSTPLAAIEILSQTGNLEECATNFFAAMRRLDASDATRIVALRFPEQGLGRPLNDRLQRASAK